MGKGPKKSRDNKRPRKLTKNEVHAEEDMDDEIDAFHKQRDVIPLNVNEDLGGTSDEDNEQPVFDFEQDDAGEEDADDYNDTEYKQLTRLAKRIGRVQDSMRRKFGGVEDEMHDDEEEEDERKAVWGSKKNLYYSADNVDYELQSSDEDLPAEEEAEVLRLQQERAKSLRMEDFGLEDEHDEVDSDKDVWVEERHTAKRHADEVVEDGTEQAYEVKKDLNALTKEEQMDVVYSSAPELVGLLSELNDALNQLESKVDPLLCKVKEEKILPEGAKHYLEVKKLLLLTYCQAISFYLLLKSEGHVVRDHPVIARLVEIKNLLDKMKEIDGGLPSKIDEILSRELRIRSGSELAKESATSEPCTKIHTLSSPSNHTREVELASETAELAKVGLSKESDKKSVKKKYQNDQVGLQSMEMLKVRASLEEKLKRKGIYGSVTPKPCKSPKRHLQPINGRLETLADFDDEVIEKEVVHRGVSNGFTSSVHPSKLSQLVAAKVNQPKVVSGDDDLPARDDIGERRRKFELQILAKAGAQPMDDLGDEEILGDAGDGSMDVDAGDIGEPHESEDEFYKEVKRQRAAKLSAKAELYSRTPVAPSLPETEIDGKRQITYQMEKNKGLTRTRKKLTKIPRKKYKVKHQKAVVRRKGQVREIRKPSGPYGGELSGINTRISRSIRFNS
ncbi:sas10/U3 ribonucleoprotein (Utp) family protein [Tasmannia lanceolata]|uniref:sas10/U3 ribonucleoprotein (Utp) family protein n=1 Tax=Tasmannia lanceolata TaxID=3420 RepID=UPI004064AF2D